MTEATLTEVRDLRVIIAGERFGYPHGLGATARVAAYARGLRESGATVHVVSLMTPGLRGPGANAAPSGVHDGVSFEYACGTRLRAASFVGRRFLELRRPFALLKAADGVFAGGTGPRAIIAYTAAPGWITLMALVARARGARCLVEVCELPLVYERSRLRRAVERCLLDQVAYRLVDGFIAISTELERYLDEHASGVPRLRIPILVAVSEFEQGEAAPSGRPRQVVYTGDLGHEGEIADLLGAFAIVAPSHPDVVLTLVGGVRRDLRARIVQQATERGLTDRVVFAGHAERARLPGILGSATALVLLRKDGAFSRAGLPTKLAEYLASGRPVVVTATGDIPLYLTDGVDAYLAPPGDRTRFAEQLSYVLEHEDEAREVGARGRQVALRQFDFRRHGERLAAFISSPGRHSGARAAGAIDEPAAAGATATSEGPWPA